MFKMSLQELDLGTKILLSFEDGEGELVLEDITSYGMYTFHALQYSGDDSEYYVTYSDIQLEDLIDSGRLQLLEE